MRAILGCATVLGLACGVAAAGQAKIDAKLLVGKWELAGEKEEKKKDKKDKDKDKEKAPAPEVEKPPPGTLEFAADGKMSMVVTDGVREFRATGTYKVEADKLTVEMKLGEKEVKETLTIKSLTAGELVTVDSKSKTETLKKK